MSYEPHIAWFTPFSEGSAIGGFGLHVAQALASHAVIDFWIHQNTAVDAITNSVIAIPSDPFDAKGVLSTYDLIVYNIADGYENQDEIHEYLRNFPGIVILHDSELPPAESVVSNALGLIVHSDRTEEKVRDIFNGPIQKLPLVCDYTACAELDKIELSNYAHRLFPFLEKIWNRMPLTQALERIGEQIHYTGVTPDMPLYETVTGIFQQLFCSGPSRFSLHADGEQSTPMEAGAESGEANGLPGRRSARLTPPLGGGDQH